MERKVKTFVHVLTQSFIPHARYYSRVLKTSFVFSFKYFLALIAVCNIILIAFLLVRYNPKKIDAALTTLSTSLSTYPQDLIITVRKGRLITNSNRPYFLWFDTKDKKNLFLVIDETASADKFTVYKSMSLLTAESLVTQGTYGLNSFPLSYLEDQKITKDSISELVRTVDKFHSFLVPLYIFFVLALILFVPLVSLTVTLAYLILASLMVFLLFKFFMQKHFHFKKILQVSLHAVTFPLLLDYSLMIIRPTIRIGAGVLSSLPQIPLPMLFLIILSVFTAVGVYEAHETGVKKV